MRQNLELAAQFMIIVMLSETIAPDYNLNESVISKLGIISSTALLFNISLFLVGILNIIGGFLYYQSHKDLKILIPFLLAGIGASGAGIFSLNTPKLHVFFAIFVFLFFNLQAIVTSFRLSHFMKYISLFMGILGFIYVVIMIIGDAGVTVVFDLIGHGGTERMIVYPPIFWLMVFGGFLMKKD
ncbi:MAG: DUF998 domain-containing protein [Candidatus Lokiarchaeota archaeon]